MIGIIEWKNFATRVGCFDRPIYGNLSRKEISRPLGLVFGKERQMNFLAHYEMP
jgi:hypothetical protein